MPSPITSNMVLAVVDIQGFTAACRNKTDSETYEMLNLFYNHAASIIADASGKVIKAIGDSILMAFPESQARQAVVSVENLKVSAQGLWSDFDATCVARIHAHFGPVASGHMGPDQRFDVIGKTVNDLFLMHWNGPEISSALRKKIEA